MNKKQYKTTKLCGSDCEWSYKKKITAMHVCLCMHVSSMVGTTLLSTTTQPYCSIISSSGGIYVEEEQPSLEGRIHIFCC